VGEWAMTKEERGAPRAHSRPENGRPTARPLVAEGEGEGEGEVEGEVETEGEWEGERAVTRTIADVVMLTNGEPVNWSGRIWAAWNLAFESRGLIAPTAPKDQETVRIAAETATCARWKTLEQLADEFWRTHVGLEGLKDKSGKRYGSGLTAVLNNLGKQWGEDSEAPTKAERRRSSVAEFSDDPSTGLPYDPRR